LPALVALGVASAYYFAITGTFWAVTGDFTRWGGHVISWFGYTPEEWSYFKLIGLSGTPLDRIDGVMIISMLLGALCAALWANNVSLRWPTSKRCLAAGADRRHRRWLRCVAVDGLQLGGFLHWHSDVLAARQGVHAGYRGWCLDRREDLPVAWPLQPLGCYGAASGQLPSSS